MNHFSLSRRCDHRNKVKRTRKKQTEIVPEIVVLQYCEKLAGEKIQVLSRGFPASRL